MQPTQLLDFSLGVTSSPSLPLPPISPRPEIRVFLHVPVLSMAIDSGPTICPSNNLFALLKLLLISSGPSNFRALWKLHSKGKQTCQRTRKSMAVKNYIIKLKLIAVRYDSCSDLVYINSFPACLSVSEKLCIILHYLQRWGSWNTKSPKQKLLEVQLTLLKVTDMSHAKAGVVCVNILPGRFGINRWWQEKEHIIQSTKNDEKQWEQHSKNTPVNHKLILFSP